MYFHKSSSRGDSDSCHQRALNVWGGQEGSRLCRCDLGPHPVLLEGGGQCAPQVSPEAPQGAQAYTAAPREKGSPTHHRSRRQALPAPWATPLTPFSTVDEKAALGAGPARSECALPSVIRAQPLHALGSS